MHYTSNLNLRIPDGTDPIKRYDWETNFEKLDEVIGDVPEQSSLMDEIVKKIGSPSATSSDIGKSLSPLTVEDGEVTSWQFTEGGGAIIDDEAGEGDTDKVWSADKTDSELSDLKNESSANANAILNDLGFEKTYNVTVKNQDITLAMPAGKYRFSDNKKGGSLRTTIVLYKEQPYSSSEPSNVKTWDNKSGNQESELVLTSQFNYIRVWTSINDPDIDLTVKRIGNVSGTVSDLDNTYGKMICSFPITGSTDTHNNISGLDAGKNVVVVFTANTNRATIKLDTHETYDASSANILTVIDTYRMNKPFTSDIIKLDKTYKSISFFNGTSGGTCSIYEVSTMFADMEKRHETISPDWIPNWFTDEGAKIDTEITDGFSSQFIAEKGLYLVTFPDELVCTYNIHTYSGDRGSIVSNTPFSVICEEESMKFGFKRKDGGNLSPSDQIASQIVIYHILGKNPEYDIVIAASNTDAYKKKKADIVLNGSNDTRVLSAVFGCYHSINALLLDGDYYISEMWSHSSTAKISLSFNTDNLDGGKNIRRYINVRGESKSNPTTLKSVRLFVTQTLHETMLNSGVNYFLMGTPYSTTDTIIDRMAVSCNLENMNIIGYLYDKPITYIDTTRCLSTMIDSVNIRSWAENIGGYIAFDDSPNPECCGIRVGRGNTYGIHNYVKHLNVWYCGKGVACNGEHFVFEDVKVHHNLVGFYFGDRHTVGVFTHANTMIGCCIEQCKRLMILSMLGITEDMDYSDVEDQYRAKSTLFIYGLSTELMWDIPVNERVSGEPTSVSSLPIHETVTHGFCGRIEAEVMSGSSTSIIDTGSCANFDIHVYK